MVRSAQRIGTSIATCLVSVVAYGDELMDGEVWCTHRTGMEQSDDWSALMRRELGPGFEPDAEAPSVIATRFRYQDVVARADAARARILGEVKATEVPAELESEYRLLMSR
jgi:hypothetical protein